MAYQNIPSDQYWNEPTRFSTGAYAPTYNDNDDGYEAAGAGKGTSNKKKWIIGGVVLGVLAIAGIVAGVVVSQMNKKSGGSGSGSDSGSSGSGSGNGTTDLSNPSQFDKDSRLHQSFWAIAYTPEVSLYPIFPHPSRTVSDHINPARMSVVIPIHTAGTPPNQVLSIRSGISGLARTYHQPHLSQWSGSNFCYPSSSLHQREVPELSAD